VSSPFGPITLICNYGAGRGGVGKTLPEITTHLDRRELDYSILHTDAPGHAIELARRALKDGSRFLVAVGGDGTIHEVVNGMIEDDRAVNPDAVLGVVAAGTGSDFIKTFGLPSMPAHAVAHLDGPESFPIDIGKVTYVQDGRSMVRYFPNIAEVGLGARVAARAARLPRMLGPTVYFFAFWIELVRHKSMVASVDLVDRIHDGYVDNIVVANGQFFGGGMKIAPKAAPTDGLLDVQIHSAPKKEAIALLPKIYKGEHLPHPNIHEAKRVRVSIDGPVPLPIEADGEPLGHTPATFEVLRDAISLKV
jgi:diacylglycerol kinase (ATP)